MNGTKDAAELKTGISATLNRNLQVVAEASLQKGRDGYQNTGGMISLRYGF
jgi:outer membrane autotransporter protein